MGDDWFRNHDWNEDIARCFEDKLRRARNKEQYLRIQASMLASVHPTVALDLLDRYFQLPYDFDHAQAHVDRAKALVALGRIDEALDSYESALAREAAFPRLLTQAYLELPLLVVRSALRARYDRALAVLDGHEKRCLFPVDHFLWHGLYALVLAAQGAQGNAVSHAQRALEAASRIDSGLRHHSRLGLVTRKYDDILARLDSLVAE